MDNLADRFWRWLNYTLRRCNCLVPYTLPCRHCIDRWDRSG